MLGTGGNRRVGVGAFLVVTALLAWGPRVVGAQYSTYTFISNVCPARTPVAVVPARLVTPAVAYTAGDALAHASRLTEGDSARASARIGASVETGLRQARPSPRFWPDHQGRWYNRALETWGIHGIPYPVNPTPHEATGK